MSVNDSFDTLIKCQKIVSIQENLLKSKIRNIDNALSYITGVKTKLTPFSESPFTTDMSFKTELEKSCIPRIEMINKIKSNNVNKRRCLMHRPFFTKTIMNIMRYDT